MPPLREMHEDLEQLIVYLLKKHHGGQGVKMTAAARDALLHYNYPGNFRELENILERAVALAANNVIDVEDLQIHSEPVSLAGEHIIAEEPNAALPGFQMGHTQLQDYLDDVERQILQQALTYTRYNRTQAAKVLGISFRSMRYRLDRLSIE